MTDTIYIYDNYQVFRDETLDFLDQSGFRFESNDDASLTNRGSVHVHGAGDLWGFRLVGAFTNGTAFYFDSLFHNRASGEFVVHAVGDGQEAYGYLGVGWGPAFQNDGKFVVISEDDNAWGVSTNSSDDSFVNNGTFEVSAFGQAFGVSLGNGGTYVNTGLLSVHGGEAAVGVALSNHSSRFDNTGTVSAVVQGKSFDSVGVSLYGSHAMTNSGVIAADVAIAGYEGSTHITNTGMLRGRVELGSSTDVLLSSGMIRGSVDLGMGDDSLDGAGGRIVGVVYGGLGADTLLGGSKSDVMHGDTGTSGGQDTGDVLMGRRGDDQLFGDGGKDKITGGAGADILSGGRLADVFIYEATTDSTGLLADRIADLGASDRIDLSRIDADVTQAGDQAFTLVAGLGGHAGELALSFDSASDTTSVQGDVDGDGAADLLIYVDGDHSGFLNFVL